MRKIFLLVLLLLLVTNLVYLQTQYAIVQKSIGTANVKPKGSATYNVPAKIGMGLNVGDAIKTGADGFVAIIFTNDKSELKIRKDSEIEIRDELTTRIVKVSQGRMLADVKPGAGKSYRIETPTSVASVKGTKFFVISQPGFGDKFYGIEGQVDIVNLITGLETTLSPGQMITSTINGDIYNIPVDPEDIPKDAVEEPSIQPEPTKPSEPTKPLQPGEIPSTEQAYVPEAGITPTEQPEPEKPKSKPSKSPFGMGLGVGSVTIDGKIYNQIALRPELRLGKLAIALDMPIYMDEQGNIRKNEWDELSDIPDKIYYLRWGEQGDPFFAKLGALDNVTLGYGILVNGYSNTTEYPQVRKIGVHTGMQTEKMGWELFIANMKEITGPGLLAGRVTYKPIKALPLVFGTTLVSDVNQYKGLKDTDGDYVPDVFDAFPEKTFTTPWFFPGYSGSSPNFGGNYAYGAGEIKLKGAKYSRDTDGDGIPDEIDYDIDGDGLTDNHPNTAFNLEQPTISPEPFNTEDNRKSLTAASIDIGMPIVRTKIFKLDIYGQAASFVPVKITYIDGTKITPGWGIGAPGLKMNLFKLVNIGVEYRLAGKNFLYGFWDRTYDFERVVTRNNPITGRLEPWTKDQIKLRTDPMQGVFGQLDFNIFNFVIIGGYYQHMILKNQELKSLMGLATIPKGKVPRLAEATAYYQRNNDPNPFKFKEPSENTILGYKIGFELGGGAVLYYKFQKTYRDSNGDGKINPKREAISLTTIETGFSF